MRNGLSPFGTTSPFGDRRSSLAERIAAIPFLIRTGAVFQDAGLTPAVAGDPVGLWRNEGEGGDIAAPTDGARPLLQAVGSLMFDGIDDNLSNSFGGGSGPSDCDVYFAVKSTDTQAILARGQNGTHFIGGTHFGSGSPIAVGAGAPTTFIDGSPIANSRHDLYTGGFDGTWHVVWIAGADLSAWQSFIVSGHASGWRVDGEIGPRLILYDNSNGLLSDQQRDDIHAFMMEGLT